MTGDSCDRALLQYMSRLPTLVLTDLWLSSRWMKGLCWVAEVAQRSLQGLELVIPVAC